MFDADAWQFARKLCINAEDTTLLDVIFAHPPCWPVLLVDYVAHHELSNLAREIQPLLARGRVVCHPVAAQDLTYRRLRREGVHKGEAASLAWLLTVSERRPLFVARDAGALRAAAKEKVARTDLLGLAIDLIDVGALNEDHAEFALSVWNDKSQELGRPVDWSGFDETYRRRRALGHPYFRP